MCLVLKVSQSGYYKRLKRPISRRKGENMWILSEIKRIRAEQPKKQSYGSPRLSRELGMNKDRVARIMRANGIKARIKQKFVVTTNSRHTSPVAPNLLKQNFKANEPDRIYVSDITYIPTAQGWLYLAAVLDLYSRKVVGWASGAELSVNLAIRALNNAWQARKPGEGTILHSDRGSQYASRDYAELAGRYKFLQSMSGSGNCYDNAVMESFFHSLKTEWVSWNHYKTRAEATSSIFDYIETFYNRERRHSKLGYLSPVQYEKQYEKMYSKLPA
jgi:transposase InsO family protein